MKFYTSLKVVFMAIATKKSVVGAVKKKSVRVQTMSVSALSAKILGRSRTTGNVEFTASQLVMAYATFNAMELAYALTELVDKKLVKQTGSGGKAIYVLTEQGCVDRISVG